MLDKSMEINSYINSMGRLHSHPISILGEDRGHFTATVICLPENVVDLAEISAIELGGTQTKVVRSFAEVCSALLTEKVDLVVLVETPETLLDVFQRDVVARLAGEARVLLLTLPAAMMGTVSCAPAARPANRKMRADAHRGERATVGFLMGDERTCRLWASGKPFHLSNTESALLWVLLRAPDRSANVSEMKAVMRNPQSPGNENTLRVFMHRIRRKLADAGQPAAIVSSRNSYELVPPNLRNRPETARACPGAAQELSFNEQNVDEIQTTQSIL
jgi:Transcriptional regulatory protein, C terminal